MNPAPCGCVASDAWRCARARRLDHVACWCECHRLRSPDRNVGVTVPAAGPLTPDEREWMRLYERGLAARAKVEDELLRAARGADPMPDAAKLRDWARRLGVPPCAECGQSWGEHFAPDQSGCVAFRA